MNAPNHIIPVKLSPEVENQRTFCTTIVSLSKCQIEKEKLFMFR